MTDRAAGTPYQLHDLRNVVEHGHLVGIGLIAVRLVTKHVVCDLGLPGLFSHTTGFGTEESRGLKQ